MYKPEDVTVLVGTVNANSNEERNIYKVVNFTPHPKFDIFSYTLTYDIGNVEINITLIYGW